MVWYDMEIKDYMARCEISTMVCRCCMVYIEKFKLNMTTVLNKKLILMLGANTILFETSIKGLGFSDDDQACLPLASSEDNDHVSKHKSLFVYMSLYLSLSLSFSLSMSVPDQPARVDPLHQISDSRKQRQTHEPLFGPKSLPSHLASRIDASPLHHAQENSKIKSKCVYVLDIILISGIIHQIVVILSFFKY